MAAALAIALGAAGCAGLSPLAHAPASTRSTPAGGRAPGAATPASAAVDSGPSREALEVLRTIPEPLADSERVSAPEPASPGAPARVTGTMRDTLPAAPESLATARDSTLEAVPTPEPTRALGDRPGGTPALAESALVAPPPPPARPAAPDTCWRLQIGAPPERAKADALLAAATSQLLAPFVIEHEKTRYKVRSRDCLDRAAVNALKARALASGFPGAFALRVAKRP